MTEIEELELKLEKEKAEALQAEADLAEAKLLEEQAKIEEERLAKIARKEEIKAKKKRLKELKAKLPELSRNNVYYVEAFGWDSHWGVHHRHCLKCECDIELGELVGKLEAAKKSLELKESLEKAEKEARAKSGELKLKALGITKEELKELLK